MDLFHKKKSVLPDVNRVDEFSDEQEGSGFVRCSSLLPPQSAKKMYLQCDSMAPQGAGVTTQMFLEVLKSLGNILFLVGFQVLKTCFIYLFLNDSIRNWALVAIFKLLWLPALVQQQGGSS